MAFAGFNYIAVLVAAIAGWLTGALWYGVLGKSWVAAQGRTMEEFKAQQAAGIGKLSAQLPFLLALVAAIVMSWVLAGMIGHLGSGQVTLKNGVISAGFVWLGFVATTITVGNAFSGHKFMLTVIDSGHWLAVLVVMGAIIGAWGV